MYGFGYESTSEDYKVIRDNAEDRLTEAMLHALVLYWQSRDAY